MQEAAVAGDLRRQPDAPKRRRPPFRARGAAFGAAIGQTRPHVVQQKVGVGPDQLEALLRLILQPVGDEFRHVAASAARLVEDLLAGQDQRIGRLAPRGHRKVARIEGDEVEARPIDLQPVADAGLLAALGAAAGGLGLGAIARRVGMERRRQPHVAREGARRLLLDGRCARLQAKAAQHRHAEFDRGHDLRPPRDPVAIGVLRVGMGQDVGRRDRLQQPQPDHLRRHAGREQDLARIAHAGGGEGVGRRLQLDHRAVLQRDGLGGIGHVHPPLGGLARRGEVLQLPAIDRMRQGRVPLRDPLGRGPARDRQSQEHRDPRPLGRVRRMAAPVLQVAILAAARIEERPQPVRRLGRGGRRDPGLAEQRIAQLEIHLALEGHVARALREGIGRLQHAHRGAAARLVLELLGPGVVLRRGQDRGDALLFGRGAGDDLQVTVVQPGPHLRPKGRGEGGETGHGEEENPQLASLHVFPL